MTRYFARFNVDTCAWEVFDTQSQSTVESFGCQPTEELKSYAECRALAHANRMNQATEGKSGTDVEPERL